MKKLVLILMAVALVSTCATQLLAEDATTWSDWGDSNTTLNVPDGGITLSTGNTIELSLTGPYTINGNGQTITGVSDESIITLTYSGIETPTLNLSNVTITG